MANTIDSALKRVGIAQAALNAFVGAMAPLSAFTTDYSADAVTEGDTIQVKYLPAASAALTKSGAYTVQNSTMSKKTLTFGAPVYVSWELTDEDAINTAAKIEDFGYQKGFALAKAVFQGILADVTAANFGTAAFVGAASAFDSSDVIDIKDAVDAAGTPESPRSLILSSAYYNALLKDGTIKDAGAFGVETMQSGKVANVAGFRTYGSTLIPANAEALVGFSAFPSGLLVASRYFQPPQTAVLDEAMALTDERLGLTIGFKKWYDPLNSKTICVLECMYAHAVGEAAAIKRITSA